MGEGGEYGGRTDDRQREVYESKEHDKEIQERNVEDIIDEQKREMNEYRENADEIANELEREMEDEGRAHDIANELEKEMGDEGISDKLDDDFEQELGHDLDEVRDDLHDDFVNDMEKQLEDASTKESMTDSESIENDTGSSSEMTQSSESYGDAGGGIAYAIETKGGSEGEIRTEAESETEGELENQSQESVEQDSSGESNEGTESEKFTNKIEHSEDTDHEAESEPITERSSGKEDSGETRQSKLEAYVEGSKDKTESQEPSASKTQQEFDEDVSEPDATETDTSSIESKLTKQSRPEGETREFEDTIEGSKSLETKDEFSEHEIEPSSEAEREIPEAESEPEPKNLDDFVERVKKLLDEKQEFDDNYDCVQDPLTGEIQRVPKILSDFETEEQKHRRKLRNLFAELSEEERKCFKKIIREKADGENEHSAEAVEKAWGQIVGKAILYRENETNTRLKVSMKESDPIQETKKLADELLARMSETEKRVSFLEVDLDEMEQKNVQRLYQSLEQSKTELERELWKNLKIEETEVRIGVVDNRVYLWISDKSTNSLLNAWSKQYYYFKTKEMIEQLQENALCNLGLNPNSSESKLHFNRLMDQILQYSDNEKLRKSRHLKENRIHGETLKFLLDSMGRDTELLENGVTKITGIKGQGGLENPAFPKGEELEILRARVIGTVVSDGQVRGSKGLMYYESSEDRINRFENTLRNFGDIHLKRKFRKSRGVYEIYINSAMSEAAIFWGIPEGDRTILNYGLPSDVHSWSKNAQRALIQDMFSQEGCVSENGEISWNRRHALCAGNKSEKYAFHSKLSQDAVEFLRTSNEANRDYEKGNAGEIYLTIGQLEEFRNDQDKFKANAAKEILQVVYEYRNQLIEDEVTIVRGFGIKVQVDPMQVSYYKRSGRVSVRWQARIRNDDSKMKCAFLLKPNDSTKERIMDDWFSKQNSEDIDSVRNNLENEGYEIRSTVPRHKPQHDGRDPS